MSIFEFLTALYAIVAGLGISLLVRSIGQMIEARDRLQLYWVHTGWIALIFVGHVVSWFTLWGFADHTPWTILEALLLLGIPILLYLVSHLAVPELEDERTHDMRTYYFRQARWIQGLMLAMLVAGALAHIVIEGRAAFTGMRATRLALVLTLLPGIVSLRPWVHGVQTATLLFIVAFAVSLIVRPIG
jgi:hypothetical protein